MDTETGSALGIAGVISGALAILYTWFKHSQCHSNCLGRKMDLTVDLTPVVADKAVEKISIPPV